ncbi:MAG: ABC transporter ATP-binding protein [Clostridia bacterium]|nr:ABC transporter ATP-binding protein [Clostridia bacterium]
MNNIIEIKNLTKCYGKLKAVDDLSFKVKRGELFAFLGVNGAGKSTTISVMCGALKEDAGSVTIDGLSQNGNMQKIKESLGVVFQNSVLDMALSVYDNLKIKASLYGITGKAFEERLEELSDLLDLKDLLRRRVGKLSGGQKRRIDIARALFHHPKILILDEPTTGLDPQTRKTIWSVIENLRAKEGLTVFLTTHYMEEAADADYVVILDSGKIVAEGSPHDLKNKYVRDFVTLYSVDEKDVKRLDIPYERVGEAYRISVKDTKEALSLINEYPDIFSDIEIIKGKMDDVFLAVTGKSLAGGDKQ